MSDEKNIVVICARIFNLSVNKGIIFTDEFEIRAQITTTFMYHTCSHQINVTTITLHAFRPPSMRNENNNKENVLRGNP